MVFFKRQEKKKKEKKSSPSQSVVLKVPCYFQSAILCDIASENSFAHLPLHAPD